MEPHVHLTELVKINFTGMNNWTVVNLWSQNVVLMNNGMGPNAVVSILMTRLMVFVNFAQIILSLMEGAVCMARKTVLNQIKYGTDLNVFAPKIFTWLVTHVSHALHGPAGMGQDALLKIHYIHAVMDKYLSMVNAYLLDTEWFVQMSW